MYGLFQRHFYVNLTFLSFQHQHECKEAWWSLWLKNISSEQHCNSIGSCSFQTEDSSPSMDAPGRQHEDARKKKPLLL